VEPSRQKLKTMAAIILQAKADGDHRYLQFVLTVTMKTGKTPSYVEDRIREYAAHE